MSLRPSHLVTALAATAVLLAGCGSSTPSALLLTDPKAILAAGFETLLAAKSAHLHADVAGTVKIGLPGIGGIGTGTAIDLKGTTVDGDLDLTGGKGRITVLLPSLFNAQVDAIAIGTDQWLKVSLLSSTWSHSTGTGGIAAALADPKGTIVQLKAGLDRLVTPPVKVADESCGGRDCYHVRATATSAEFGTLLVSLAGILPGLSGDATVDVWVEHGTNAPTKLVIVANGGASGQLKATLLVTDLGKGVTIDPPPADQVNQAPTNP